MPLIQTRHFGTVEYDEASVLEFPEGLPAFEQETRFVIIERSENAPLIFLQSLHTELCFLTAPAVSIEPNYTLRAPLEELAPLGMEQVNAEELLCLAILTVSGERPPTANLMAPVIIHRKLRRAKQVIQYDSGYSFEHPLQPQVETC